MIWPRTARSGTKPVATHLFAVNACRSLDQQRSFREVQGLSGAIEGKFQVVDLRATRQGGSHTMPCNNTPRQNQPCARQMHACIGQTQHN